MNKWIRVIVFCMLAVTWGLVAVAAQETPEAGKIKVIEQKPEVLLYRLQNALQANEQLAIINNQQVLGIIIVDALLILLFVIMACRQNKEKKIKEEMENNRTALVTALSNKEKELEKIRADLSTELKNVSAKEEELGTLAGQKKELEVACTELEKILADKEKELNSLASKSKDLEKALTAKEREANASQQSLKAAQDLNSDFQNLLNEWANSRQAPQQFCENDDVAKIENQLLPLVMHDLERKGKITVANFLKLLQ